MWRRMGSTPGWTELMTLSSWPYVQGSAQPPCRESWFCISDLFVLVKIIGEGSNIDQHINWVLCLFSSAPSSPQQTALFISHSIVLLLINRILGPSPSIDSPPSWRGQATLFWWKTKAFSFRLLNTLLWTVLVHAVGVGRRGLPNQVICKKQGFNLLVPKPDPLRLLSAHGNLVR